MATTAGDSVKYCGITNAGQTTDRLIIVRKVTDRLWAQPIAEFEYSNRTWKWIHVKRTHSRSKKCIISILYIWFFKNLLFYTTNVSPLFARFCELRMNTKIEKTPPLCFQCACISLHTRYYINWLRFCIISNANKPDYSVIKVAGVYGSTNRFSPCVNQG